MHVTGNFSEGTQMPGPERWWGCWSFREVGCSLVVAVVNKETIQNKRKESRFGDFPNSSPLSLFVYYLVLGGETKGIKGGKRTNPQEPGPATQPPC